MRHYMFHIVCGRGPAREDLTILLDSFLDVDIHLTSAALFRHAVCGLGVRGVNSDALGRSAHEFYVP